ncbi:MAG: type I glutamate--ammonia ligase [Rhodospirillales bacterium]|nr:type I glutamate--ammonia ligase [Rhodospirillales bacterium]MCY4003693.1 type I glutamate--ammonia ligase [Rhodospirillales bacterium]MYE19153.1 type I glutamate--ammonia ligase [Rhodospirillales bacterium]
MASDVENVLELIREKNVEFVDFRFTDPRGKWQHVSQTANVVTEDTFADGVMFDGSSIAGWKDISQSDMCMMPDASTAVVDPFTAQPTLILFCNILEPTTGEAYERDPRSTAVRAEAFLKSSGIGDTAYFGPEAEFFVFDDVRWDVTMNHTFYRIDSEEGPYNSGEEFEGGNVGHRPVAKGGYFPVPPVDSATDLRSEMVTTMAEMGLEMEKHHHEVAPSQHELGLKFSPMLQAADSLQIYKYCVHMVAHSYGKTATFMPKPVVDDNGSGMHVHQSVWKGGAPLFAGDGYAGLSETCLHYIGGIIKHARTLNAFTNPTTNSYKRLVPGFEAPTLLAYSARNRSASCRIPFTTGPNGKRVEVRFPDPSSNPYLAFAAMLMAGLDGIRNRIHPGDPLDKNLYDLAPEERSGIATLSESLKEAVDRLESDHDFLTEGGVFSKDAIEGYIELRREEIQRLDYSPHPAEFDMYYSV